MLISIVNHTKGKLPDEQVLEGIRAVNRQIAHDFQPYWDFGGELRLEGTSFNVGLPLLVSRSAKRLEKCVRNLVRDQQQRPRGT